MIPVKVNTWAQETKSLKKWSAVFWNEFQSEFHIQASDPAPDSVLETGCQGSYAQQDWLVCVNDLEGEVSNGVAFLNCKHDSTNRLDWGTGIGYYNSFCQ